MNSGLLDRPATPIAACGALRRGSAAVPDTLALPKTWETRWRVPLEPERARSPFLVAAERILLGDVLHDGEGAALARLAPAPVAACADTDGGLLISLDERGGLVTRWLEDAEVLAASSIPSEAGWTSPGLSVTAEHLFLVADRARPGGGSVVATVPLESARRGEPPEPTVLELSRSISAWATARDALVLALGNRLLWLDPGLRPLLSFEVEGEVVALEVERDGWMQLVVRGSSGTAWWLVTPEGERPAGLVLPPPLDRVSAAPRIGPDHGACLIAESRVALVTQTGELRWMRASAGRVTGALPTKGGGWLVAEGPALVHHGDDGEREVRHLFTDEAVSTRPCAVEGREIVLATERALQRLGPGPG